MPDDKTDLTKNYVTGRK